MINQIQECRAVINQIQECRAVINRALPSLHGESLQITNSPFNLSLNMFFYSKQNVFFMKVEHCNIKILHFCEKFAKEMCSVHRPSSLIKLILNPSEKNYLVFKNIQTQKNAYNSTFHSLIGRPTVLNICTKCNIFMSNLSPKKKGLIQKTQMF